MNSEELELSLRTEFESYLKDVLADMRQEITEFQEKVEAEFNNHKLQLDGIFQDFSARVQTDKQIDDIFKETVVEHLRLARDEGARITATAIGEAEELAKQSAPAVGISELRDAINDISNQTSQAAILKTLVQHAAQFTPRGAFFIVKNEHFVGWRVFGKEELADEQAVREVFFPVASSTILGEAVRSLSAVESSYGNFVGDSIFLNKLEFGHPSRMFAIPLVARGRGVAVLYADYGAEGEGVNVEALETLVRFAGLTVEVLASSQNAKTSKDVSQPAEYVEENLSTESGDLRGHDFVTKYQSDADVQPTESETAENYQTSETEQAGESAVEEPVEDSAENDYQPIAEDIGFSTKPDFQPEITEPEVTSDDDYSVEETRAEEDETEQPVEEVEAEESETPSEEIEESETDQPVEEIEESETPVEETYSWNQPAETEVQDDSEEYQSAVSENGFSVPSMNDYQVEANQQVDSTAQFEETPQFEPTENYSFDKAEQFVSHENTNGKADVSFEPVQTVSESVSAAPVKTRFSDRNVDLPIEVGEEERRLHNDARRFARLLVSEIKLYNEQKVKEGREGSDLYERLREAIDRSREMYDKRVQPPVAAKFDYFHYELVSTLAEGEETKLGGSYPGATI